MSLSNEAGDLFDPNPRLILAETQLKTDQEADRDLFVNVFRATGSMALSGKQYQLGPYAQQIIDRLPVVPSNTRPEHLWPTSDTYAPVDPDYAELSWETRVKLRRQSELATKQRMQFGMRLAREEFAKELAGKEEFPDFILDEPPYSSRFASDGKPKSSDTVLACFRMLVGAVSGRYEVPRLTDMSEAHYKALGSYPVHEDTLIKALETPEFRNAYTRSAVGFSVTSGFSLSYMAAKAEKIRASNPMRRVYCTVALQTSDAGDNKALQHHILLGTTDQQRQVVTFDPAQDPHRNPQKTYTSKLDFYRRLAVSLGHAYVVVIGAPKTETKT